VRAPVRGGPEVGVTQNLRNHLQRDALREQQRRAGVPQVVEADMGQHRSLERRNADKVRIAAVSGEDKAGLIPLRSCLIRSLSCQLPA
jgi:hypothetical protein